ncbi:hypothetical protein ACNOYE_25835 [Nannocystaceae bacterium ST9]
MNNKTIVLMVMIGLFGCVIDNRLAKSDDVGETDEGSDSGTNFDTADDDNADTHGSESGSESGSNHDSSDDSNDAADSGEVSTEGTREMPPDLANDDERGIGCELLGEVTDACQVCVDLYCCDAISLCGLDGGCLCLLDCLLSGSADAVCQLNCGLDLELPSLLMTLDCLDQQCDGTCPSLL